VVYFGDCLTEKLIKRCAVNRRVESNARFRQAKTGILFLGPNLHHDLAD